MKFAKVFPMLIAKAERKGRTREEVYELTEWLTRLQRTTNSTTCLTATRRTVSSLTAPHR